MTSRERVLSALNHEEPDRVPLDIGGGVSSSISVEAYEGLKEHLGVDYETRKLSVLFRVARLDKDIQNRLGADVRPLLVNPSSDWEPPKEGDDYFTDEFGTRWRKSVNEFGFYWELEQSPMKDATIESLDSYQWPDPHDPARYEGLAEKAKRKSEETSFAIMVDPRFKNFFERAYMLRGYGQFLRDLAGNQEFVKALMEKILEINLTVTEKFLKRVGEYADVIRVTDDLATQDSLLMSPATYRELIKPYQREYIESIKNYTDARVFYHSDGNIEPLIEDFIDIGVDAINPVQVSALEDVVALKEEYGERISFWGGVDTQSVLCSGSPRDVREEVEKRISQLAPGGGFVIGAVHNIQPDVPPENIVAMSEAVRELGSYPVE